jgi:hypothetical protein
MWALKMMKFKHENMRVKEVSMPSLVSNDINKSSFRPINKRALKIEHVIQKIKYLNNI